MLDAKALSSLIQQKLEAKGYANGEHSRWVEFCDALSEAVVEHIQGEAVAEVQVSGGSSAGKHTGVVK